MLTSFYKQKGDDPPQSISQMERESSLVDEVRNYLQEKRYLVVFDDVWNLHIYKGIS